MAQRKSYFVSPGGDGSWKVKAAKAERASSVHENKAEAVQKAKQLAKSHPLSQVVVQKSDGTFQTEYTYGKDPYPPKG